MVKWRQLENNLQTTLTWVCLLSFLQTARSHVRELIFLNLVFFKNQMYMHNFWNEKGWYISQFPTLENKPPDVKSNGTSFRRHDFWYRFGGQTFVVIGRSFPEATSNQSKLTLVHSND